MGEDLLAWRAARVPSAALLPQEMRRVPPCSATASDAGGCRLRAPPGLCMTRTARRRCQRRRQLARLKQTVEWALGKDGHVLEFQRPGGVAADSVGTQSIASAAGLPSDGQTGTHYEIKFVREFVDLRADLDLIAQKGSEHEGVLCIQDWVRQVDKTGSSEDSGGDEGETGLAEIAKQMGVDVWRITHSVDSHIGFNPIDVVYDGVVLGNGNATWDHACCVACLAGAELEVVNMALEMWIEYGVMEERGGKYVVVHGHGGIDAG